MASQAGTPEQPDRSQRIALAVLMGLTFLAVAWMASPLLVGLALGTVMGFTAQPMQTHLTARWHGKRRLASAATTLFGGLVVTGSAVAAVWVVARELGGVIGLVEKTVAGGVEGLVGPRAARVLLALGVNREAVIGRARAELGRIADIAAHAAGVVVQVSAGALLTLVVALWTMYSVLVDWPRIVGRLERLLPLDPRHTRALVDEFREVGRRAFVGTVASAVVQGGLASIGFAIFGVPQAAAWGAILALMSFIPVIGVLLVWVPAAVWLVTAGHVARAILLTIWCLIVVMATSDYVIRPLLVGRGQTANPLLMLVALLGGISVFGAAGVIVGPVIMSLFLASAHIYERERM
jgi:predicted PurR-regulated permease PerM